MNRKNIRGLLTQHRIGLAVVVCVVIIMFFSWGFTAFTQLPKSTSLTFQPAQQVLKPDLLQKIIQENYQPTNNEAFPNAAGVQVVTVRSEQQSYWVFDFNDSRLCGRAGCLYSAYTTSGQKLLSLLLNPRLNNGFNLFVQSSDKKNGFPCLDIYQPQSNKLVSVSHYCYDSRSLVLLNQSVSEIKS